MRRYPALVVVLAAAMLATLLPGALTLPLAGPSASAELAPVPGKGEGRGDLSALGGTSGEGLGGSREPEVDQSAAAAEQLDPGAGPGGRGDNPVNRRCVGKPARQTEDPMSPTCVPFFRGENGGATWKGVTGDEIRVVVIQTCTRDAGFQTVIVDYDDPALKVKPAAALTSYFNARFQAYDRRVHLFSVRFHCETPPLARLQIISEELDPFYVISLDLAYGRFDTMTPAMAGEAARLRMMASVPYIASQVATDNAPFLVSYVPHLEIHADNVVESVCARLAGGNARFAGDATYHEQRRKFGLYYAELGDPESVGGRLILDGVKRRCGSVAGEIVVGYMGQGSDHDAFAKMRLEGVTTVIIMIGVDNLPLIVADQQKYYPEWFFAGDAPGRSSFRTNPPTITRGSFGIMGYRRLGRRSEQHHRMAYAEACPGCAEPPFDDLLYEELMLLFTGIQAAGPKLDPFNFERGLLALPKRQSRDPFAPSAYFAPGDHSFTKDYAFTWWDPTGRPPGESRPGCWRLVEDGVRYRAQDWASRPGDDGIQRSSPVQACQGERP